MSHFIINSSRILVVVGWFSHRHLDQILDEADNPEDDLNHAQDAETGEEAKRAAWKTSADCSLKSFWQLAGKPVDVLGIFYDLAGLIIFKGGGYLFLTP